MTFQYTDKPIIVVGDAILDKYIYGTASRLSPEAPVPVAEVQSEEYRLGGAANVAANIRTLGGNPILVCAPGQDVAGTMLCNTLTRYSIPMIGCGTAQYSTTEKTRIVVNGQQIVRLDNDAINPVDPGYLRKVLEMHVRIADAGALIISDYANGMIDHRVVFICCEIAQKYDVPVFVDPRVAHTHCYANQGVFAITPNLDEAIRMAQLRGNHEHLPVDELGVFLCKTIDCLYTIITQGAAGATLVGGVQKPLHFPAKSQAVFDVSGAGDTFVAALALAYASNKAMQVAVYEANTAAGIAVGKPGTATVTFEELQSTISHTLRGIQTEC